MKDLKKYNENSEHTMIVPFKRILLTVRSLWLWTADRWRSMFWWWCRTGYVNWHLLGNARQIIRFLNVRLCAQENELVFFARHHIFNEHNTLTIWCMWCEWFPPSKFSCVESCCCCCCPIVSESKTIFFSTISVQRSIRRIHSTCLFDAAVLLGSTLGWRRSRSSFN